MNASNYLAEFRALSAALESVPKGPLGANSPGHSPISQLTAPFGTIGAAQGKVWGADSSHAPLLPICGPEDWDGDEGQPIPASYRANIVRRQQMGYSESDAVRWAYGAALDDWHSRHGARIPSGVCAGCGAPLRDGDNLHSLPDGALVHAAGHQCLIAYGRKWRGDARAGLSSLGTEPPEGWEDVD